MATDKNDKTIVRCGGIGLGTLSIFLTILFLVLQLCNVIAWKWVFVFLPIIIYAGIWVVMVIVCFIILVVAACIVANYDDEYSYND